MSEKEKSQAEGKELQTDNVPWKGKFLFNLCYRFIHVLLDLLFKFMFHVFKSNRFKEKYKALYK